MLQFAFKQVNGDLLNDPALHAPRKRSSWTFQISTSPATAHGGAGGGAAAPARVPDPTGRPGSVVLAASAAEEVLLRRSAACCASTAARSRTPTATTGALRRLGACLTNDAARCAVSLRRARCGDRGGTGGDGGLQGPLFGLTP
jgi:hypothetical protein